MRILAESSQTNNKNGMRTPGLPLKALVGLDGTAWDCLETFPLEFIMLYLSANQIERAVFDKLGIKEDFV